MPKTSTIRARIEPQLKDQGENVLKSLGISTSDFINMTFRQLVMRKGIPFDVRVFNDETVKMIKETKVAAERGELETFTSTKDLMDWLNEDETD